MQSATAIDIRTLAAQLTTVLSRLRQRDGATQDRIKRLRVPGGDSRRYDQTLLDLVRLPGSLNEQAQGLHSFILKTSRNLEGTVGQRKVARRDVALCCLGLDAWTGYGDLMTRRTALAAQCRVSSRVVRDWEDQVVIPALAHNLALALREPVKNEDRGYKWISDIKTAYFDNHGWISAVEHASTVMATRDGIQKIAVNVLYLGDCTKDTMRVRRAKRCKVVDVQFDGIQRWVILVELPRVLSHNDSHTYELGLAYNISSSSKPAVFISALEQRIDEHVFQLQFHPDKTPEVIWCFNNAKAGSLPSEPKGGRILNVDASGYLEHGLCEPVEIGGTSGIAWRF